MKAILFLSVSLIVLAYSQVDETLKLRCSDASAVACSSIVQKTLDQLQCEADVTNNSCYLANEVDGNGRPNGQAIYCDVHTKQCSEAKAFLFGGTYCPEGTSKHYLDSYDNRISLSYAVGFGPYVTKICRHN